MDLLTYQPKSCDYPNFRQLMTKYGHIFTKRFIYISEHYTQEITPNIDDWLIDEYQKLNFTYVPPLRLRISTEDWCDFAIKAMLAKSESDSFLIIHPDFISYNFPILINGVMDALKFKTDLAGYVNSPGSLRIQPAFFACKRKSYEKTSKDFSAKDGYDHCEFLSEEMFKSGMSIQTLEQLGFNRNIDFQHVSGVTQAYLWGLKSNSILMRKDLTYFEMCLNADVPLNPIYVKRVRALLKVLKSKYE